MSSQAIPQIDDEVRRRLGRRYGSAIGPWLHGLPDLLGELIGTWHLELNSLVRRGTVSVVLRCRDASGNPAILKVSPDRERIATEARTLAEWRTTHLPQVLASDARRGALLLEEIRLGTALDESGRLVDATSLAALVRGLHEHGPLRASVPALEMRIASLYRSGEANYIRRPDLEELVPRSVYERGRHAAEALANTSSRRVVLHGDLTPANVLTGDRGRGFVAIDPAPCWGDPSFDTVDLLMWQVNDLATLTARCEEVEEHVASPPGRLLNWCAAFAAMDALEQLEAISQREPPPARTKMLIELATEV